MRRPVATAKGPVEGSLRTWSSPELEIAAEVLEDLRSVIRALDEARGSNTNTATALGNAAKSLVRLQHAAGALASDDERLTDEDMK